eukprot:5022535-Alexandrium_andersonii.AAC.1
MKPSSSGSDILSSSSSWRRELLLAGDELLELALEGLVLGGWRLGVHVRLQPPPGEGADIELQPAI